MAEKTKNGENSTSTNADLGYIIPMPVHGHTSPADRAGELFTTS